jgi:bifunctional N-acetylglucosamine-1-phosphate-uridyltransferase/glucosamine-1-phosphate-acetyltransferase GlmU-like protein
MSKTPLPDFYGLILAAGMGKRLRRDKTDTYPKALRPINGRPMIGYVLDALKGAGVDSVCVVIGVGADRLKAALGRAVDYAYQDRQLGSGHATASAKPVLEGKSRHVIVMCGDSPLFTSATVSEIKDEHLLRRAAITLASAQLNDPTGYGRIIRKDGRISAIVEEKVASPSEKAVKEVNGGLYAFDSIWLWSNIHRIQASDTGELCLTDMVQFAIDDGKAVAGVPVDAEEVLGVNTPEQLRQAEEILQGRSPSLG